LTAEIEVTWRLWIPMRDGVRLAARLYRAKGADSSPAIVTMTPYAADRYHEDAVFFARAGYAFVIVDCRGRGDSEGQFVPSFIDFEDGHDTIEWVAKLHFCDGQVAMWGGSYAGENQWNTLVTHPPHLRTIVPAAATHTPADYPWRGPVRSRYALLWLLSVSGHEATPTRLASDEEIWLAAFRDHHMSGAAFRDLPRFLGGDSVHFDEYLAHPAHHPYWQQLAFSPSDYAGMDIPILTITGHYDEAQRGSLHYVREHERHGSPTGISRHFVVIGPWDHEGTRSGSQRCGGIDFGNAAEVDLRRLTLDWYDWTLRGGPRPALLSRRVVAYDTGAGCWTGRDRIFGSDTEDMPLFLEGGRSHETPSFVGRLTVSLPRTDSCGSWHSDPADCRRAEAEARPWADWLTEPSKDRHANETGLVWETDPLSQDIRLFGWPKASLWIETTLPDADLQATLAHVDADGSYLKLSDDLLRLRYREGAQQELPCTPGAPMRAVLDGFTFVSRLIRAGGRLRLTVRTVNSIHLQRNFQAGGNVDAESRADARAGWICIRQGGRYDSRMSIPLAVRT